MSKKVIEILNNLEEELKYGCVSKREVLEILNSLDLTNIRLENYKKIKKLLKI